MEGEAVSSRTGKLPEQHAEMPIPLFQRLVIESHSYCNRSCWFCPRTYDRSGAYRDSAGRNVRHEMPTERILDLLDQAATLGFEGLVAFHFYGEALFDPRCVELAWEAKKRKMKPYLHTNADAMKTDRALRRQVADGFERIIVGLYDHETDEALEDTKRDWLARLPDVDVRFSTIGRGSTRSMAVPRALVPVNTRIRTPDLTYTNAPCSRPLVRMLIRYDGEVCNCCEDAQGEFGLGNANERSLADLWFGRRHVEVVNDLRDGRREKHSLCTRCPQPPTSPPPDGGRVSMCRRTQPALHRSTTPIPPSA